MANKAELITDLLIERATRGLTAEQAQQLADCLRDTGTSMTDFGDYDRVVAAVDNAIAATHDCVDQSAEPLPATLREKLTEDAGRFFARGESGVARLSPPKPKNRPQPAGVMAFGGWAIAATLLVFVLIGQMREPVVVAPDHAAALAELTAEADTIVAPWAQPDAAEFSAVSGEVIWNDRLQSGYMRLAGMPVNEPGRSQYQLWIVDPDRDEQPVDGGVFDIPDATGEWLIPIDAKLTVDQPTVFAITREKPGGVVVSDGPLLVIASV